MDLTAQYATVMLLSAAGAILGAIHDIYRTSLKEWRFLRPFSAVFDLAFWIFALIFVFSILLGVSDGDLRFVTFVLLMIGYGVYYKTLHPLIVASTRLTVRLVIRIFRLLFQAFNLLFVQPVLYIFRLVRGLLRMVDRSLRILEPWIVWPVVTTGHAGSRIGRWGFSRGRKYLLPVAKRGKELGLRLSNKYRTVFRKWWFPPSDGSDGET